MGRIEACAQLVEGVQSSGSRWWDRMKVDEISWGVSPYFEGRWRVRKGYKLRI